MEGISNKANPMDLLSMLVEPVLSNAQGEAVQSEGFEQLLQGTETNKQTNEALSLLSLLTAKKEGEGVTDIEGMETELVAEMPVTEEAEGGAGEQPEKKQEEDESEAFLANLLQLMVSAEKVPTGQTEQPVDGVSLATENTGVVDLTERVDGLPNVSDAADAQESAGGKQLMNPLQGKKTSDGLSRSEVQREPVAEAVQLKGESNGSQVQGANAQESTSHVKSSVVEKHSTTIQTTVRQEVAAQTGGLFKVMQPDKIVIQLKPMELGIVEVTIEQVDGDIRIKMMSDNKDVQELLDSMTEDIQSELRQKGISEGDELKEDGQNDEKTKEEARAMKKEYEEEKEDSFEELLNNWLGGSEQWQA